MTYTHKRAEKVPTKDLLDMESFGGAYADIFPLDPTGITNQIGHGGRAGRATAMAEAIGKDPGFSVNYPLTSNAISTLLGALAGAGLGYGGATLSGNSNSAPLTAGVGALGGGLAGMLLQNISRRGKMKEIAKAYEDTPEHDIYPKLHDPSFLDIGGGYHNRARQRAIAAMLGDGENPSKLLGSEMALTGGSHVAGQLAGGLVGLPGHALSGLGGLTSNLAARNIARKNKLRDILFRMGVPGDEALLDMLEKGVKPSKQAEQKVEQTASIKFAQGLQRLLATKAARNAGISTAGSPGLNTAPASLITQRPPTESPIPAMKNVPGFRPREVTRVPSGHMNPSAGSSLERMRTAQKIPGPRACRGRYAPPVAGQAFFRAKQALLTPGMFSPYQNQLANYGVYTGGGALAGAGLGTLINALRGKSKLKGALIGGGLGAAGGAGLKGLSDILAGNSQGIIRDYIRSGYLADKAKKKDTQALEDYGARTEDNWTNYAKDLIFGKPEEVKGTEYQDRNREFEEEVLNRNILDAIRENDIIGGVRGSLDVAHGLDDFFSR